MTYEMYHNVFLICAAASGVMAFLSILLFVLFRIPSVIGDLTGITARRGIEQIRKGNSKVREHGRNTEKLPVGGGPPGEQTVLTGTDAGDETALLSANAGNETALLSANAGNETTVLQMDFRILEEITILHSEEEGGN